MSKKLAPFCHHWLDCESPAFIGFNRPYFCGLSNGCLLVILGLPSA